jgi:hypothetical protein
MTIPPVFQMNCRQEDMAHIKGEANKGGTARDRGKIYLRAALRVHPRITSPNRDILRPSHEEVPDVTRTQCPYV